jgi:O-antigen/teichoic acid export membrane protein
MDRESVSLPSRCISFVKSRIPRLRNNLFVRKAAVLSSGSAIGHLFSLALSPLLTRAYRPEDFAALGLFTSFLSVAGVAVSLQYETSIISASDEAEAASLAICALCLGVPISVLAGLALWLMMHYALLGFGALVLYAPVALSLVMCFVGVFVVLRYWSLRQQNFALVSQSVAEQSAARVILQGLAGLIGFHSGGLIVGETLGRGVGMGRMFKGAWPQLRGHAATITWSEYKRYLWKNRKFPLLTLPSSFMDALCISLTVPLLIQNYGTNSGGNYAMVWRVLSLPGVVITLAVADTFHSQLAERVRNAPEQVLGFFANTCVTLLVVGCVPCAILFLWAKPLFALAFGSQWGISGAMASLIAPWYLGQFVVNPISRAVYVLSGQATKMIWDVLCTISLPTVFYIAKLSSMDVIGAVRLLSTVSTVLYIIYFAVVCSLIIRFHRSIVSTSTTQLTSEAGSR